LAAKDQQIVKTIKIIGLALTIPTVLVCGPLLGYGAAYVLIEKGAPPSVLPLFVGVGSILALVQTFRTAKLILSIEEKP
jgi:hypothetical protein